MGVGGGSQAVGGQLFSTYWEGGVLSLGTRQVQYVDIREISRMQKLCRLSKCAMCEIVASVEEVSTHRPS